jgi:serine protease Do
MGNVLQQLNQEMTAVVERVRLSLVHISNGRHGTGAGVLWQSDGLTLSTAHVIRSPEPRVTLWDGRTFPARVLDTDTDHDLAVLSIPAVGLTPIESGTAWPPRPGQWVLAFGHPWGVPGAVTVGSVIAVGAPPEMPQFRGELLQVGLHVRPGYSGGPLVDAHGYLVGLNMMMAGPDVGLTIPLPVIKAFLRRVPERV